MLAPQAIIRGLVSRILPAANPDTPNVDVGQRFSKYGEGTILSYVRKAHLLADEGSYFIVNNAQSGLATSLLATTFSATAAFIIGQNTDSVGGKRVYLDYMDLVTTAAGVASSGLTFLALAVAVDTGLRFSSLGATGVNLTSSIISPNMDISTAKSVFQVYCGTLTATAASSAVRYPCGQRTLRPTASGTAGDVVGEEKLLNFGPVEGGMFATYATLTAINSSVKSLPPVVIGPQQSVVLYLWSPGAALTTGISYAPEIGWWER